jgi:hypothetical protein
MNVDDLKRFMTRNPVVLSFHPLYKILKPKPKEREP